MFNSNFCYDSLTGRLPGIQSNALHRHFRKKETINTQNFDCMCFVNNHKVLKKSFKKSKKYALIIIYFIRFKLEKCHFQNSLLLNVAVYVVLEIYYY